MAVYVVRQTSAPTFPRFLLLLAFVLLAAGCGQKPTGPGTRGTSPAMIEDVIQIARDAGAVAMRHYDDVATGALQVDRKSDDSPVTRADKEANELIVGRLAALTPDVPAIAEESDLPAYEARKDWARFWLVDPLDGTKEFLKRNGEFTVNIALIENGEPVLGVLYAPAVQKLYYAARGLGAFKQEGEAPPVRIHSRAPAPGKALTVLASRSHATGLDLETLLPGRTVETMVSAGSALKFGLLAEGAADVYVRNVGSMEWDVAAGDCIYRLSGEDQERASPFLYNKPDVTNTGFVLGLEP